ncbi:uncharacterized protein LOC144119600 [Amblyomma americanum]
MSAAGRASETPLLNLEPGADTNSSLVTESPELTNNETKTQADKIPRGSKATSKTTSSSVGTLDGPGQAPGTYGEEYHGHEGPVLVNSERKKRKKRHRHKKSLAGSRSRSKGSKQSDVSAQPTEHNPEKSPQDRASKVTSVDLPTFPSTPGATDTTSDLPAYKETCALRPSISGSVQSTDFHTGDDPDSLGRINRPSRDLLLIDSVASREKVFGCSTQSARPRVAEIKDMVTSSFFPNTAGNSESFKMQCNGLPDSPVERASSPRHRKLDSALVICALTVAILMAILLLVVVILAFKVEECDRLLQLEREPVADKTVCFNTACEMAVALLNKWQNPNVQPCNTFHRHVCGRWRRTGVERPNYAAENRNNFLVRAGLILERVANSTKSASTSTHHMALFYASCRRFAVEQRIIGFREALHLSGIDFRAWLTSSSFQDLFSVIVAECLRTGLTSVISVKVRDQRVYIDLGNTLAHFLPNQTDRLASVIEAAASELPIPRNPALVPALVNLDSHLHRALAESPPPTEFHSIAVHQLPTQALVLAWVHGLNRGLSNKMSVHRGTVVSASGLTEIRGLIGILSSVEVRLASIYSLMLPIAQVMSYSGAFHPFGVDGSRRNHLEPTNLCLRQTAERFPMEMTVWITQAMETPEARGYFDSMLTTLGHVIRELPTHVKGHDFNASDIDDLQMKTTFMPHQVPPRAVPVMDRDDFLRNMIALSGQVLDENERSWLQLSRQQLNGDPAVLDGQTMVIPTLQLTGDLFHSEANDPMLDYSTVGVRVLVEWANTILSQNPAVSSRLIEILRNRSSIQLPLESLPEDALRWMLFLPWALDLALIAARMSSPMTPEEATVAQSRDQLFFRRFCQAGCGDAREALHCSYGTRYSALFAKAFECQWENYDCPCS